MAGSYKHIVNDDGTFAGVSNLDNLSDAYDALEECFHMIDWLSRFSPKLVEKARAIALDRIIRSNGDDRRTVVGDT